MKTIDEISHERYGKNYNQLPDDGAEQDCVQGIFSSQPRPAIDAGKYLMILQLKSAEDKLSQYDRFKYELEGVRSAIQFINDTP